MKIMVIKISGFWVVLRCSSQKGLNNTGIFTWQPRHHGHGEER
ncbi:hypothetical protein X474_15600 [Dethiosulfatarculus sandiegensis]|uniref:Uncharacterized protein n=1 Tax=Dethiosulfatarculus sandiegensis TaxID=1429043 RepID=A0A0D2J4U9_9BACT|nr:hypothetical protein X474_15600 [Dethiosulfatarculus sandiegensis]